MHREPRRDRGLALVSVLWGVAILSVIASAMLYSGLRSGRMSRNDWSRVQAETAADSGVQRAILALLDTRASGRWPVDGRGQSFSFNGLALRIAIQDERGRIDLNKADPALLASLFQSEGVAPDDATALVAHIVDWRTPAQNGGAASSEEYVEAGYTIAPRGGPFRSLDELKLVMGMTPTLFARVVSALTIFSRQPSPDTNVAPREVLVALPGIDGQKADEMIAARSANSVTGAQSNAAVPLAQHVFSIVVDVELGSTRVRRRAVVELTGDAVRPFLMRDWD